MLYVLKNKTAKLKEGIVEDPNVVLVDELLSNAINISASDIHLEPRKNDMRIRYRVDGVLYDKESVSKEQFPAVLSRLKVLASLDIAEQRIPQDGKIGIVFHPDKSDETREIDLRISTFPSLHGEKMVIRILDRLQHTHSLNSLGMNGNILEKVNDLIQKPQGFFLVTGPTGSGKTTTLYAILSQLNKVDKNIVTMEDPIEYNIEGITQSQINEKAGFTFERGLRSLLRQDPDVILIGEIRDKQTVQIAIEAALTGHLVLSTMHTNDAASAVTRLLDMGVEPFLITAALNGVLAQRLARTLCSHCKQQKSLEKNNKKIENLNFDKTWDACGCDKCFKLGHKGRTGIFEWLSVDNTMCDLIMEKATLESIREQAVKNGMKTLLQDASEKVKNGEISLDEFLRIVNA
jgi:type II secretory ATPase GspE/PulE/Tfp pilus assembly ATPase PilB-like protein